MNKKAIEDRINKSRGVVRRKYGSMDTQKEILKNQILIIHNQIEINRKLDVLVDPS